MEKVTEILAGAALLVIVTFAGCQVISTVSDNRTMKAMVTDGSDPIDARCAVRGYVSGDPVCAVRAATKGHSR